MIASDKVFQPTLTRKTATWAHVLWIRTFKISKNDSMKNPRPVFRLSKDHFHAVLMIGMLLIFYPNIWSTKCSKLLNSGSTLIGWSCATLNGLKNSTGVCFHIAISISLVDHVIKTEQMKGVLVVVVKGTFLDEPEEKVFASVSASTSSSIFLFSRCA